MGKEGMPMHQIVQNWMLRQYNLHGSSAVQKSPTEIRDGINDDSSINIKFTTSRVHNALSQLVRTGKAVIVGEDPRKSDHGGRPRKLYALKTVLERETNPTGNSSEVDSEVQPEIKEEENEMANRQPSNAFGQNAVLEELKTYLNKVVNALEDSGTKADKAVKHIEAIGASYNSAVETFDSAAKVIEETATTILGFDDKVGRLVEIMADYIQNREEFRRVGYEEGFIAGWNARARQEHREDDNAIAGVITLMRDINSPSKRTNKES